MSEYIHVISPEAISPILDRMNYRLSDAIREGASVTTQAVGWSQGETACALHGAVIAAKARKYL